MLEVNVYSPVTSIGCQGSSGFTLTFDCSLLIEEPHQERVGIGVDTAPMGSLKLLSFSYHDFHLCTPAESNAKESTFDTSGSAQIALSYLRLFLAMASSLLIQRGLFVHQARSSPLPDTT